MLIHGLMPMRMSGLVKNTLWDVVVATGPKPSSASSPTSITVHRVVKDLSSNSSIRGDHNLRFRCFICSSLNHHFLEDWLMELYRSADHRSNLGCLLSPPPFFFNVSFLFLAVGGRNEAVLKRFYLAGSFLSTCPESVFQEVILSLQPLMVLPFRLFMSFETNRRSVGANKSSFRQVEGYLEATPDVAAAIPVRRVPQLVRAVFDNHEPDEDELMYSAGDLLTVETRVNADWYLCSFDGRQGLVRQLD